MNERDISMWNQGVLVWVVRSSKAVPAWPAYKIVRCRDEGPGPLLPGHSPKVLSVVLAGVLIRPERITLTDTRPLAQHVLPQHSLLQLPTFLKQLLHGTRLRRPLVNLYDDRGERLPQHGVLIQEGGKATLAVDRQSVKASAKRLNRMGRRDDSRPRVIDVYSHIPVAVDVAFCVVGCDDLEAARPNHTTHHLAAEQGAFLRSKELDDKSTVRKTSLSGSSAGARA